MVSNGRNHDAPQAPADLERLWELCWHPVCTLAELRAQAPHPLAVTLLDRSLAIADLGTAAGGAPAPVAFIDRCPHRSTRLSVGWIEPPDAAGEPASLRCAYHGWRYGSDGHCFDVPAMPDGPIPPRACAQSFDAEIAYDLVWVRIDPAGGT
ncbi:MAG: hypothetical protein JWL73_4008, partial [Actinomycetia bacterium]|nr:hypothetical protein [Actinomycetes bacterium]